MGEENGVSSSIRVVAARTGIRPHTLRVWERRYGFPRPNRRADGVRSYSEEDIAKLRLVARALEAGYRAGEVVSLPADDLARLLEATLVDVARDEARLVREPPDPGASAPVPPSVERVIHLIQRDEIAEVQRALRSFARTHGAKRFVTELAHPLAVRIGDLWSLGELEVRHEHLASACLTRQLHSLADALHDAANDEGRPVVVLATLSGEPHVLPLDMVAVFLAACGAGVRMVGADTPAREIAATARAKDVDAVGLSISGIANRERALHAVRELLGELPRRAELWLGGAGAAEIAKRIPDPGVFLVESWEALEAKLAAMR